MQSNPMPFCKQCRLLSFEETSQDPLKVKTRVLVKLQLKLPWEPVLAWPWGVEHVYNPETGRIAEHVESWEIAPMDGVMQVRTPLCDPTILHIFFVHGTSISHMGVKVVAIPVRQRHAETTKRTIEFAMLCAHPLSTFPSHLLLSLWAFLVLLLSVHTGVSQGSAGRPQDPKRRGEHIMTWLNSITPYAKYALRTRVIDESKMITLMNQ
jgi:hypothetical protein